MGFYDRLNKLAGEFEVGVLFYDGMTIPAFHEGVLELMDAMVKRIEDGNPDIEKRMTSLEQDVSDLRAHLVI